MKKNFIIPDELKGTFARLMNLVPDKLKNDAKTQKTISVYLKLGGEKLARQCVQVVKSNLPVEDTQNTTHDNTADTTEINEKKATDPDSPDVDDFEFSDK